MVNGSHRPLVVQRPQNWRQNSLNPSLASTHLRFPLWSSLCQSITAPRAYGQSAIEFDIRDVFNVKGWHWQVFGRAHVGCSAVYSQTSQPLDGSTKAVPRVSSESLDDPTPRCGWLCFHFLASNHSDVHERIYSSRYIFTPPGRREIHHLMNTKVLISCVPYSNYFKYPSNENQLASGVTPCEAGLPRPSQSIYSP